MSTRVMVDMSVTLLHHGHIRLLKKAAEYGEVVVGLTRLDGILCAFNFRPSKRMSHHEFSPGKI